jgi:hypothetical protein
LEVDRGREFAKLAVKRQLTRGKRCLQIEEEFSAEEPHEWGEACGNARPGLDPEEESKGFRNDKVRS